MKGHEQFPFPIVSDRNRMISLYLNVLDAKCIDEDGIPLPCRAAFVLAPDMTIQLIHFYPQTIGRNFEYLSFYNIFINIFTCLKFNLQYFIICSYSVKFLDLLMLYN